MFFISKETVVCSCMLKYIVVIMDNLYFIC